MSSFSDLTSLLEQHPDHRLVIVREDGTPVGVFMSMGTYRTLLATPQQYTSTPKKTERAHPSATEPSRVVEEPAPALGEWDTLVDQVSGQSQSTAAASDGDTYLFEPVE